MRRLLLAVVLLGALPSPAAAQYTPLAAQDRLTFRGVTGQDRPALITYDVSGRVDSVEVVWRPRCRRGTRIRVKTTAFGPAGDQEIGRVLDAVGRYRMPESGGRIGLIRIRMRGRLAGAETDIAHQVWSGTLRARIDVRRHGVPSDRCALSTRWRARPEGIGTGRWEMSEGYTTPARSFDSSATRIVVKGTPQAFDVLAEPDDFFLDAWFRAPSLNRLRPGVRYAIDEEVPGAAQFTMFGGEDSCNGGSFVVHALEFDELRRLVHVRVSWEQPCPDGRPPWTGTIEWRATA